MQHPIASQFYRSNPLNFQAPNRLAVDHRGMRDAPLANGGASSSFLAPLYELRCPFLHEAQRAPRPPTLSLSESSHESTLRNLIRPREVKPDDTIFERKRTEIRTWRLLLEYLERYSTFKKFPEFTIVRKWAIKYKNQKVTEQDLYVSEYF